MKDGTDWIAANVRILSFHVRHALGQRNMLLLLHGPSLATRPVSQANKMLQDSPPQACSETATARKTRNQGGYIVYSACRPETSIRTSFPLTDAQHHLARGKGEMEKHKVDSSEGGYKIICKERP